MPKNVFDEMGVYWAEIADQDQTQRQVQFLRGILKPDGAVLDLACGSGRHLIPLSREGYDVVGLDSSSRLLKIAQTRLQNAQLVRADMGHLPFKPETFAAAISMDTSFGYLPSEEDDLQCLREVKAVMRQGGVFVVDVFNRERLMRKRRASSQPKWREHPSFYLLQKRSVTADGHELHDEWTTRSKADGKIRVFKHVARLYERKALEGLLEQTGFDVQQVLGGYEGEDFSPDSDRLILVACTKLPSA